MRDKDYERFRGDVIYDVWRNGGNPDSIDEENMRDGYNIDRDAELTTMKELERQRTNRQV
jgi:hypothetical protein